MTDAHDSKQAQQSIPPETVEDLRQLLHKAKQMRSRLDNTITRRKARLRATQTIQQRRAEGLKFLNQTARYCADVESPINNPGMPSFDHIGHPRMNLVGYNGSAPLWNSTAPNQPEAEFDISPCSISCWELAILVEKGHPEPAYFATMFTIFFGTTMIF